ncbi:uncharacterized protein PFL1_06045 [Pseudozyma flocculosa PF-1]|uniref:Major facilitator superfamily (MFS) profile domain-containing protein n=2 Tax=Pseudozyma flocculosa TaxID=84751 RepID=A0A5C3F4G5_9BASI|nr:uncharacterized protein PFL1_06045 [Pseudozyma flocculosa PF-1]EPQ26397.1 hypothetical protein PFL1_06045 [Pseudozyma flocculosa PF-1]SPO39010.1 uncharacterized protein PSFLO_04489 [Pseudozyma flocculosa]
MWRPTTELSGNAKTLLICATLATANIFSGYDTASAAAVIADQSFIDTFHLSASMKGAFASLINVGNCLAYLGPLVFFSKWFGRRWTMVIGDLALMAGASLVAGSRNEAMLLVGRVLCGLGVSLCQGTFAAWTSEIASAEIRGTAIALVQVSYQIGVFVAFWISLGTAKLPNNLSWRTLTAIQMAFGAILLVCTLLAPESPRQLLNRAEDPTDMLDPKVRLARDNHLSLRKLPEGDVRLEGEWTAMQTDVMRQRAAAIYGSPLQLLRQRNVWRRILIGAGSCIFAQLTGVAALMLYGITVFQSLNLGGKQLSLIINGLGGSLQLVACFMPLFLSDRWGRRNIMLFGIAVAWIGYLFLGALFERWPDAQNRGAGVWMVICIFAIQCAYAGALGSACIVLSAEIWPQALRDFGISVSFLGLFITVIVVNQLWPVLSDALTFRLYWVMLGINTVTFITVFLFWPETKLLSLEQMDQVMGSIEARASLTRLPDAFISDDGEQVGGSDDKAGAVAVASLRAAASPAAEMKDAKGDVK